MNDDFHRHLDGELPADALDPAERSRADAWERMLASYRTEEPGHAVAPPWLEQRVMAEIEVIPERGPFARALTWLIRPTPVRVPPIAAALTVAAFAAVLAWPSPGADGPAVPPDGGTGAESVVFVQFVLDAPGAQSVAVVGDFSEWEPTFTLEDPDGDGVWTGRVPVQPGVHSYMFLIDGSDWQTDPNADRYQDDGFGNRNAVLAVGE